jgi:hypothetical protein
MTRRRSRHWVVRRSAPFGSGPGAVPHVSVSAAVSLAAHLDLLALHEVALPAWHAPAAVSTELADGDSVLDREVLC